MPCSEVPHLDILGILEAIDRGEVRIHAPDVAAARVAFNCVCKFRLSNGWIVSVFADCREWDYLEWVCAPDGRRWSFDELDETPLRDYHPADPTVWGLE